MLTKPRLSESWSLSLRIELEFKLKNKDRGMVFLVTHLVVTRAAAGASVASSKLVAFNSVSQQKKIFRLD